MLLASTSMVMPHANLVAIVRQVLEWRYASFSLNRTARSSHGAELSPLLDGSPFVVYRGLFGLLNARRRA